MIKFTQEKVLLLHKLITEETGGDPNVRDVSLLNSARLMERNCTLQSKKRARALVFR